MHGPWSYPDFKDFLAQNSVFENAGVWANGDGNLSGVGSPEPPRLIHKQPKLSTKAAGLSTSLMFRQIDV